MTSCRASARVTVVAAWLPVLPPVPINNGTNNASVTTSARVASNASSTRTVNAAPIASTSSQTTRERTRVAMLVVR